MKHRTFFWFILPTLSAMILFIALPIVSVFIQSLYVQHEQVLVVSESCGPFGCTETTSIDAEATAKIREEQWRHWQRKSFPGEWIEVESQDSSGYEWQQKQAAGQ